MATKPTANQTKTKSSSTTKSPTPKTPAKSSSKTTKSTAPKSSSKPAAKSTKSVKAPKSSQSTTRSTKSTRSTNSTKTTRSSQKPKGIVGPLIGAILAAATLVAIIIGVTALVDHLNRGAKPGQYDLTAIKDGETDQTETISFLKSFGLTADIVFNSDGTCKLNLFGDRSDCTYTKTEITAGDQVFHYTYTDSTITFDRDNNELTFTRKTD